MQALAHTAIGNPMAWRRTTFASPADYTIELTDADRQRIVAIDAALERAGRLQPAHGLTRADFDYGDALEHKLERAYEQVRAGYGFVVLRGLPIEDQTLDKFTASVWGIGTRFGHALSQNAQGELIGQVIDATAQDETPRMYKSNLELRAHSDNTAMISLACWHKSMKGGGSVVTSAVTVHDEIKHSRPELLEALYRGFHYHRLGEEGLDEEPVTPYRMPVFAWKNGQLSCRYQRAGLAAGQRALGIPLTGEELEAIDLFDEVARAPENRLAFYLERGDMLVLNNYTMLHARTGFTNYPEPERQRLLVRLWLDAEGFRDVPRELSLFATNGVPPQPGRHCSFDFKKLYGDDPRATGGVPKLELDETELRR